MNVAIPPEFAALAREQVATGTFASEEEPVGVALRDYLARLEELRALIDEGDACGDPVDGETFLCELLDETRALAAAQREG
jgi:Arc/MetJ-type ribon-helix-helix transcriptional regulator